ncbi:MAG: hypothetical protein ACM33V_06400 [Chloroflexota bacterium]|nr:hypothetical protein [Anaerolineales bacterium]
MDQNKRWSNRVIVVAVLLTGLGAAHLIDDFLYGMPADFGLSNEFSQVLAAVYFITTGLLLVLTARGSKAGYIGSMGFGLFLFLTDALKHGSEGLFSEPWRGGLFSRSLAFGTLLTSIVLVIVSYYAWYYSHRAGEQ